MTVEPERELGDVLGELPDGVVEIGERTLDLSSMIAAMVEPSKPSSSVELHLDIGDQPYLTLAEAYYGVEGEEWWTELGDLLGGRPGWRCLLTEVDGNLELLWSYGGMGSKLFNISPPLDPETDYADKRYRLYDHEVDDDLFFAGTAELRAWLEANEGRHTHHVMSLRDMAAVSEWAVLKKQDFKVRVTFADDTFIATILNLPGEVAMRTTLPDVLADVRQLIAHAFDAPDEVGKDLELTITLDPPAAAALALPER